jgi:hypothetical protein
MRKKQYCIWSAKQMWYENTERGPDNSAATQVVVIESQTTQRSATKVFILHHRIHSCHVEKCFKSLLPWTPTNRRLGGGINRIGELKKALFEGRRSSGMLRGIGWLDGYRRYGTNYPSPLQGRAGLIHCPETSVSDYKYTPRDIAEELRPQSHRGGRLEFWKTLSVVT